MLNLDVLVSVGLIAALLFSMAMLGSAILVFVSQREFGWGGFALTCAGVFLLVIFISSAVKLSTVEVPFRIRDELADINRKLDKALADFDTLRIKYAELKK